MRPRLKMRSETFRNFSLATQPGRQPFVGFGLRRDPEKLSTTGDCSVGAILGTTGEAIGDPLLDFGYRRRVLGGQPSNIFF
ncbi:unnamed protein product [Linum tenue]|uniref:Uncharacterized protein n=1 Tax=Linum tenue TaxID=586396 RepID=A0AAV0PUV1_9ROSI|nr:unnamed protein product [Linum tenue]